MYRILYNGAVVFDPRLMNAGDPGSAAYAVESAQLDTGVGSAGSLTFTLAPGHRMIGTIALMQGVVKVEDLNAATGETETLFLGRVIKRTENFDESLTCQCEGVLATLNDTMVPPHNFPGSTTATNIVAAWLAYILSVHNSEIGLTAHQIQPGTCTVTAEGNTMERVSDEFVTTWETIRKEGPESPLGGFLVIRYDGDTAYLDYLAEFTDVCGQEITMGANMLDLTGERSGADMFNAVLAEGADGLTLATVPNGQQGDYYKSGLFLIDVAQRDTYGLIARHLKWDEAEDTATLLAKATAALDANSGAIVSSFSVPTVDLGQLGDALPPLRIAQLVNVTSRAHGISVQLPVMSLSVDLTDPATTRPVLGSSAATISRAASGSGTYVTAGGGGGGGNTTTELLWTNPDPANTFAAQTISGLPLAGYKKFVLAFRAATSDGTQRVEIALSPTGANANVKAQLIVSTNPFSSATRVVFVQVARGRLQVLAAALDGVTNNDYLIPLYLVGEAF